jgi:hypothetical protein
MLDISTSAAALSSQATAAALHQQLLQMTQVVAQVRQDSNFALAQVSGVGWKDRRNAWVDLQHAQDASCTTNANTVQHVSSPMPCMKGWAVYLILCHATPGKHCMLACACSCSKSSMQQHLICRHG